MNLNTEAARTNMIKQQIRACKVIDDRLLGIISQTQRENFVPDAYRDTAFADTIIPLPHQQMMMCPTDEANMLNALNIQQDDNVLEIGTGTGYITAILSRLAKQVVTVDIFEDFTQQASTRLTDMGITNVEFNTGDASQGWLPKRQFDVITVTGSMPTLYKSLCEQLSIGGRLFVIIGDSPAMSATLITRTSASKWEHESLFETDVAPLINNSAKPTFTF